MLEQPALLVEAAGVAGERAVGADDAVAGDDDGDAVLAVRGADGAIGADASDGARDVAIGDALVLIPCGRLGLEASASGDSGTNEANTSPSSLAPSSIGPSGDRMRTVARSVWAM